jgi:hypothetical protein
MIPWTEIGVFLWGLMSLLVPRVEAVSDLGCSLNGSAEVYSRPVLSKPGYLQSVIEPVFSSTITRVVDDSWGDVCRHHYSKDQPWNADQSVIWINKGCDKFIDGTTYQELPNLKFPPDSGGESRWHPTDPRVIIYTSREVLGKWDPFTGENTIIATFPGYTDLMIGLSEGNLSADGRFIALYSTGTMKAFAYDLVTRTKYPDIDLSQEIAVNSVSMSYTGTYILANVAVSGSSDSAKVYDLQGNQVGATWSQYGCPSHYDFTVDQNGDDVAVGVCKTSTSSYKGIVKRRLKDGQITQVFPMGASHTSARNLKRPGWVYVSQPYYDPYLSEILALKLDGTAIERFAWIPNNKADYESEQHAVPSLDGRRVIVASNWNIGSRPVQDYVVEACPTAVYSSPTPPPKPGDLNGDGTVDIYDYNIIVANFGNPYTIFDYNILVANFGKP